MAGVSIDAIKSVLSSLVAGIKAIFDFSNCGAGIAVTLFIIAMVALIINLWLVAILAVSALVKAAVSVMLMAFTGLVGWGIRQTCGKGG